MTTFALPDLGEGLHDAEIVAWHVSVGDYVVADQPLVSVETDKAVVEIPAPRAGRVAKLYGKPGDIVPVGAALVDFEDTGASDAGAIIGEIAGTRHEALAAHTGGRAAATSRDPGKSGRGKAMPAVRAAARRLGTDVSALQGSGPGGAVGTADLERAAAAKGYEPLRGARRSMAANMSRAQAEVARTTVVDEADIEAWSAERDPTVRLVRAVARACVAVPALNAWYDARTVSRLVHSVVDLGIAIDTEHGLFVPVIRDAAARTGAEVRTTIERLRKAALARALTPDDLRGPTISLSNFGMIAGRFAALMVMPPQVAIVGAGRIERRTLHRVLPVSLSFDHRAVTGGEAARFLGALLDDLRGAD